MMHTEFPSGTPVAGFEQSDKVSYSVRYLRWPGFSRQVAGVGAPAGSVGDRVSRWGSTSALAVLVIIAGALGARLHGLAISSIDWDEGVYLVMAQQWLHGRMPYVAVWDQHPPGLPALLVAVQALIPDPVRGARLAATAAVAITALVLHRFCVRNIKGSGVGLVAALLYIMSISRSGGLVANTEVFNDALVTSAAYLLFEAARVPGAGLPRAVLAAALLGIGLQVKYVILPEAVFLCLGYLALSHGKGRDVRALALDAGLLITAGLLPTGLAIGYFALNGLLKPFLDANIDSNLSYLGIELPVADVVQSIASGLLPIGGALLLMAWAAARGPGGPRRWLTASSLEGWVALWMVAAAVNVCLPLKFFPHYFFALYPPVCLAGALAIGGVARGRRAVFAAGVTVLFLTAVPLWLCGVARLNNVATADVPRAIARSLRDAGVRDMDVFVYDYQPVIYALAGVRPPSPYVIKTELTQFSGSAHVDGVAEVDRIMNGRPRFVIALAEGHSPDALDSVMARQLQAYHAVQEFKDRNGEFKDRNGKVVVYER